MVVKRYEIKDYPIVEVDGKKFYMVSLDEEHEGDYILITCDRFVPFDDWWHNPWVDCHCNNQSIPEPKEVRLVTNG